METPTNNKAQQQPWRSLKLGLGSLMGTTLVVIAWQLWQFTYLHPLSSPGEGTYAVAKMIFGGLFFLCIGMAVACVMTAFPEGTNPTSTQGKTAILLAVLVALFVLPCSALAFYTIVFEVGL